MVPPGGGEPKLHVESTAGTITLTPRRLVVWLSRGQHDKHPPRTDHTTDLLRRLAAR